MEAAATKTRPGALDGFERAKPDEPIFTLQGGDPLGVECTKLYIQMRRERAMKLEEGRERDAELLRCTEAEHQLWVMQDYLAGRTFEDQPEEQEEPDEPAAIDLFDYRVRFASRASNMRCELVEIREELKRRGYDNIALFDEIDEIANTLGQINEVLEPRRLLKKA